MIDVLSVESPEAHAAAWNGRIAATAVECQRDLLACSATYPELFPEKPFQATIFSGVALANAIGAPSLPPARLRVACRTALWIFGVDWLIDYALRSRVDLDRLVARCLAVADGFTPAPDFAPARLLAEIRDELATSPAFPGLRPIWREELRRLLAAAVREWDWKRSRSVDGESRPPTVSEYMENADNFGSTFVNVSHWIYSDNAETLSRLAELRVASREIQRVLRLLNDLATYERDVSWGDLNILMLGIDRDAVIDRIGVHVARSQELLEPLRAHCPREVTYLQRQLGFSTGFYGVTDYWGTL
jgi:hypothetical protein